MDSLQNIELVKQCYQDFMNGDIPQLLSRCKDDIAWELPEIEGIPFAGKRQGHAQVAEFFKQVDEMQNIEQFEPRDFVAQNDKVIVMGHYAWNVKPSGEPIESDWIHVFTIRDGQIAGFREFMDSHVAEAAYRAAAHHLGAAGGKQMDTGASPSLH